MEVKNIIKTSAEFLGLKNVVNYIEDSSTSSEEILADVDNLMIAVNMVNNNIASSYYELIGVVEVTTKANKISYDEISDKSIIEIKKVEKKSGEKLEYKIMPDGIYLSQPSTCIIEYTYFPDKLTIDDNINYYLKLNEITFSLGVVAEYLYIKGSIDDAYMWDKRFKNNLFNLLRPKRNLKMPSRRW